MATLLSEGLVLGGRGTRAGVDGIATDGFAVAMTLGGSGTWGGVSDMTATRSAVDVETSAAASGSGIGMASPSLVEMLGELSRS